MEFDLIKEVLGSDLLAFDRKPKIGFFLKKTELAINSVLAIVFNGKKNRADGQEAYSDWYMDFDYSAFSRRANKKVFLEDSHRVYLVNSMAVRKLQNFFLLSKIKELNPKNVLEVGAGSGVNLLLIKYFFPEIAVTGLELNPYAVQSFERCNYQDSLFEILSAVSPFPISREKVILHQDLFQEITIQLWKAYPKFRGDSKFSTWMYRVGLNTAITLYRKSKRRIQSQNIDDFSYKIPQTEAYDDTEDQQLQLIYEAIKELNDIEKALIFLYLENKNYKEISETIGISEVNARVKMNRVKKKLKKQLNP